MRSLSWPRRIAWVHLPWTMLLAAGCSSGQPGLTSFDAGSDTAGDAARPDAQGDSSPTDTQTDTAPNDASDAETTVADTLSETPSSDVGVDSFVAETPPPAPGSLTVTITPPPSGTPNVTVTGLLGFTATIHATTTLTDVPVDSYLVSANNIGAGGTTFPDEGYVPSIVGAPVLVSSDATSTVTVTYVPEISYGRLWITSAPIGSAGSLSALGASDIAASGGPLPIAVITASTDTLRPSVDVAIDGSGNVWVLDDEDHVSEYTTAALSTPGATTATVTLDLAATLGGGRRIVFGPDGGLWATTSSGALVEIAAAALTSSGSPTPAVTLTSSSFGATLTGLGFDSSDALWVTSAGGPIAQLLAAQLTTSGPVVPSVTLSAATSGTLGGVAGLGVDGSDGVWVANAGSGAILGWDAATALAGGVADPTTSDTVTGTPSGVAVSPSQSIWAVTQGPDSLTLDDESVVVSSDVSGSIATPSGLAFDAMGNAWIANAGNRSVVAIGASDLATTGAPAPYLSLRNALPSPSMPQAVAFEHDGGAWLSNAGSNSIAHYAPDTLTDSGNPAPDVTIAYAAASASTLDGPAGLALDSSGDLWVANSDGDSVVELSADQLDRSGGPAPACVITALQVLHPTAVAFDASGNLWIACGYGSVAAGQSSHVVMFTQAHAAACDVGTADIVLAATPDNSSIALPQAIAFDASGNLWVANNSKSSVVEFAAALLTTSGAPTPTVTLTNTSGLLQRPASLAFDDAGALWVLATGEQNVLQFMPSDLLTTGSPTPAVTLTLGAGPAATPTGIAFYPVSTSLPLVH